ncbi:MAG: hypothetical protein QS721_02150 [Candidatus Endonucleobacter sp. (ex Gigantidas childressi)]|nr:hypothetical protein [Candidatus Endonucleobacter sp. (ex Gigantidas childressi)]
MRGQKIIAEHLPLGFFIFWHTSQSALELYSLPLKGNWYIPVAFQVATLLAAFAHPDHLLL